MHKRFRGATRSERWNCDISTHCSRSPRRGRSPRRPTPSRPSSRTSRSRSASSRTSSGRSCSSAAAAARCRPSAARSCSTGLGGSGGRSRPCVPTSRCCRASRWVTRASASSAPRAGGWCRSSSPSSTGARRASACASSRPRPSGSWPTSRAASSRMAIVTEPVTNTAPHRRDAPRGGARRRRARGHAAPRARPSRSARWSSSASCSRRRENPLRHEVEQVAEAQGVELPVTVEVEGIRLVADLVAAGAGASVLPETAVPHEPRDVDVVADRRHAAAPTRARDRRATPTSRSPTSRCGPTCSAWSRVVGIRETVGAAPVASRRVRAALRTPGDDMADANEGEIRRADQIGKGEGLKPRQIVALVLLGLLILLAILNLDDASVDLLVRQRLDAPVRADRRHRRGRVPDRVAGAAVAATSASRTAATTSDSARRLHHQRGPVDREVVARRRRVELEPVDAVRAVG